ncbi:MAG: MarR family winged helix-turn-helix transcriptional regulator [Sporichthyaceae bacterium]
MPATAREGAPTGADQDELWRAWDEFAAAMRRARGRGAREAGGLTHSQFRLLVAIADSSDGRLVRLAEEVGAAPPTVTRMLTALERAGLVQRAKSVEDRRGVCVRLTPAGQRAMETKQEQVRRKRQLIWDSLSPTERRQAQTIFHRLAEELDVL